MAVKLGVIVPPDIPDQDVVAEETVLIQGPFSLYCPVFSSPIPEVRLPPFPSHPICSDDGALSVSDHLGAEWGPGCGVGLQHRALRGQAPPPRHPRPYPTNESL